MIRKYTYIVRNSFGQNVNLVTDIRILEILIYRKSEELK